jgi:uncharacterized membrane protein
MSSQLKEDSHSLFHQLVAAQQKLEWHHYESVMQHPDALENPFLNCIEMQF